MHRIQFRLAACAPLLVFVELALASVTSESITVGSKPTSVTIKNSQLLPLIVEFSQPKDIKILRVVTGALHDSPVKRFGNETILVDPKSSETVEVQCFDCTDQRYEVVITKFVGSSRDREWYRLISRATGRVSYTDSVRDLDEALSHVLTNDNLAYTLLLKATVLANNHADWTKVIGLATQAAHLYKEQADDSGQAHALSVAGSAGIELGGSFRDAAEHDLSRARTIFESDEDRYHASLMLNFLGLSAYYQGDWNDAKAKWSNAAESFEALEERGAELLVLGNIGVLELEVGDYVSALATFRRAIEKTQDAKLLGALHDNLGMVAAQLGLIDEALENFSRALDFHEERGFETGKARSYHGMGIAYFYGNRLALADELLARSLALQQKLFDGRGRASTLRYLGQIRSLLGDCESSTDFLQAAFVGASSDFDRARILFSRGKNRFECSDSAGAIDSLEQSLALATTLDASALQADVRFSLGEVYAKQDRWGDARRSFETARVEYVSNDQFGPLAMVEHQLALISNANGDLATAVQHSSAAVDAALLARQEILAPEFRVSAFLSFDAVMDFAVSVRMDLAEKQNNLEEKRRWYGEALTISERGRMLQLVDLLVEARSGQQDLASKGLSKKRLRLVETYVSVLGQLDRASALSIPIDEQNRLRSRRADLRRQVDLVDREISARLPSALVDTNKSLKDALGIQQSLSPNATLVYFDLGETKSYAWVVTSRNISAVPLASQGTIALAVQDAGFKDGGVPVENPALHRLAQLVWHPVTPFLENERVLVLTDGPLHRVAFESLSLPAAPSLLTLDKFIVSYTVTASASQFAKRGKPSGQHRLLAYADPILNRADVQLDRTTTSDQGPVLPRLPGSRKEVREIARLFSDSTVRVGFDATRSSLLSESLSQYSILHLATHGVINLSEPEASALLFARYGRDGREEDYRLSTGDVLNLDLNSDLVVLSACDSRLGESMGGEAVRGFIPAVIAAGASSVVSSLWPVEDRATQELMVGFYGWLAKTNDVPLSLTRAKRDYMQKSSRNRDLRKWSAFIVHQPIRREEKHQEKISIAEREVFDNMRQYISM